MTSFRTRLSRTIVPALVAGTLVLAQDSSKKNETIAKPASTKEQKRREERLAKELATPYKKWEDQDVSYIITAEERQAFHRLATDEEREQFVEQFWLRRDPTPDTIENEYKEEHYRRIAYANDHYASGIPGWRSDRGRIYIMYGPPDENESHPSGGSYERPAEEGGGETSTYPFEQWRYRYLEGIGTNIVIEFVDPTMSGEYRMTMDPSEKDALLYVPGAGLTQSELLGLSTKTQRFQNTNGTHLGQPLGGLPESMNEFTRLQQYADLNKAPKIKYQDLETSVGTRITFNTLPMKTRVDFIRITNASVLTNVTLQFDNKDLQFNEKEGVQKAEVHLLGRITTMSRRPVTSFEHAVTIDAPTQMLKAYAAQSSIYQESIPLTPGLYRLNVIAKDTVSGNMSNYEVALNVPHFDDEKLSASSLILADQIQQVPTKSIGTGQFVIGGSKVRPRLGETFRRDERLCLYVQFYNFTPDEQTNKPNGSITYEIVRKGTNEKILDLSDEVSGVPNASTNQVTVEKFLPLSAVEPGQYEVKVKVTDKVSHQSYSVPSLTFTVS